MSDEIRALPLASRHADLGARFAPFAGFSMPMRYSSIKEEHLAVRHAAGLFDVSHMGEIEVVGADAVALVDSVVTNDLSALDVGQAMYTVMCHPDGNVVDDLIVYKLSPERVFICVNASNRAKDYAYIVEHAVGEATVTDRGDEFVQLAVQGPLAAEILAPLTDHDLSSLGFFRCAEITLAGAPVLIAATGYTGEHGFELYVPVAHGEAVFDAVVTEGTPRGMLPIGLGARDTLRLEARLHLYGNELSDTINPFEAGLSWVVKLDKPTPFVGQDALRAIKASGPTRRLRGFVCEGRAIPRPGCVVYAGDEPVGEITSGSLSYMLDTPVALGYVDIAHANAESLEIDVRGRRVTGRLTTKPFYKNT
jgi:aminomethyltransferase